MFKKHGPKHFGMDNEGHFHDERAMTAIEKDMLKNIHHQIGHRQGLLVSRKLRYAVAASVLFVCAAGWLIMNKSSGTPQMLTVSARNGHISTVVLPDGSSVWLNSGSTISYPQKFAKLREVELLNGEAFFDIKHDKQHPFIVHYGNLHTQVLGTSFNIKYYHRLNDVRVTVVNGLVEVGDKTKSFAMVRPGNEIIYDQRDKSYNLRTIDAQKVAAWRSQEVNLYDVPFDDLVVNLENIYDVKMSYDRKKMKDVVVTIHFSSSDDMKQVLEIIKTIYGLDHTIKGKEVKLH